MKDLLRQIVCLQNRESEDNNDTVSEADDELERLSDEVWSEDSDSEEEEDDD